jgi:hypothetical protein
MVERRISVLANHRLQPLGHLIAARKLSINEIATYTPGDCPNDCPRNCPYQHSEPARNGAACALGALIGTQRFFSPTTMPATDCSAPLYRDGPVTNSLISRASGMRSAA